MIWFRELLAKHRDHGFEHCTEGVRLCIAVHGGHCTGECGGEANGGVLARGQQGYGCSDTGVS